MGAVEELSDVCRRNRTVQEIVQGALRPLELNLVTVSEGKSNTKAPFWPGFICRSLELLEHVIAFLFLIYSFIIVNH
jgi:hypothetical protein